jgi:maleate isomerase
MSGGAGEHGLRTRIGIVSPDDGINDDEFWSYAPPGVTLLWTRYRTTKRFEPISVDMVGAYGERSIVEDAARTLAITRPHAVGFSCNSCTFVHGPEADAQIRAGITGACGCPATTVTHAQVEGLRALEVRRVALGAPYRPQVTARLEAYLAHLGFTVVASQSLGLDTEWQIGNTPAARWLQLAREIDRPDGQAIVLACSGIRTADVHEQIERELRKPLVSAPAVLVWHCLRLAGANAKLTGRGVLLEKH